jgi:hypothetical protein
VVLNQAGCFGRGSLTNQYLKYQKMEHTLLRSKTSASEYAFISVKTPPSKVSLF